MRAGVKRLIWALAYPITVYFGYFVSYYGGAIYEEVQPGLSAVLFWVIPLLCFKDDDSTKEGKK